jgi:hypothetical protein
MTARRLPRRTVRRTCSRATRPGSSLSLGAAVLAASLANYGTTAWAQSSGDLCFASPLDGQKLRKGGRLMEARERFAACSRKRCPAKIVAACVRWSNEVDAATPSVVLAARDAQGKDLTDVRVSIDGKPFADLSPLAIQLDPGTHRFAFERAGVPVVTERVVLREAEKEREVRAVFPPPATPPPVAVVMEQVAPPAPPAPPPSEVAPPAAQRDEGEVATGVERPVPAAVWVLAGAGGLALAGFATFAALGLTARSSDHCEIGCTQSQYDSVLTELRVGDASLGIGIVALGTATLLYLTRPTASRTLGGWLHVNPALGGGTATVGGSF